MSCIESWQVLDLLTGLVDKSLVLYEEGEAGEERYRLLETVRQYAQERLAQRGEAEKVSRRHRDYFLAVAEEANENLKGPEQGRWLSRLEADHENLRAALDFCRAEPWGAEPGLGLAAALSRFWDVRGHVSEGRERLATLLARPGAQAPTRARADALNGAGVLANRQGDYGAARSMHEEALALARELGDTRGIANSLLNLGAVALDQGDLAAARSLFEEDLAVKRELGDRRGVAYSLIGLGALAADQGDLAAARALHEEALALGRELGDRRGVAYSLANLGPLLVEVEDIAGARACLAESLTLCRQLGDKVLTAHDLELCSDISARQGWPRRAARQYGAAQALREAIGAPLPPSKRSEMEDSLAGLEAALGPDALAAARAEGRAMTWEQAIEYALAEEGGD